MPSQKYENQKAREMRHLEGLRRNYAHFPAGIVIAGEEPDFIVQDGGQFTGIEHTEWLRTAPDEADSSLRRQESEQDKAVTITCQLHASRGLPLVNVAVRWRDPSRLTTKRRKELQHELAGLVAHALPQPNMRATLKYPGLPQFPVPQEIDSIRILRFDGLTSNQWAGHGGDYVVSLEPDDITKAIAEKEPKLLAYRQKCSHVWLFVVLEGFRPSSLGEVSPLVQDIVYETGFEKVLLLRYYEGQVVELHTQRAPC